MKTVRNLLIASVLLMGVLMPSKAVAHGGTCQQYINQCNIYQPLGYASEFVTGSDRCFHNLMHYVVQCINTDTSDVLFTRFCSGADNPINYCETEDTCEGIPDCQEV
jgi:hypothetical protein